MGEEVLVPDMRERRIRQIARDQGLCLQDVERVLKVYDEGDANKTGLLDKDEFKTVLCALMKTEDITVSDRMIDRYWIEVDKNFNGAVEFEEFLQWYMSRMMSY